ncbi:MAG: S8 family serine peptidase, partial [Planctomycetota bacterium]
MGTRRIHMFIIALMFSGVWVSQVRAEPGDVVKGQCLFMFKTKVAERIDAFLEGKSTLTQVTGDKALQKVWTKYGVVELRRLFQDVDRAIKTRGELSVREAYDAFQASIRARYPARTARAPKGLKHIDTFGIFLLRFDPSKKPAEVCRALVNTGHVVYAEPVSVVRVKFTVNDPEWGNLWGLAKIGCTNAWDTAKGSGIVVAVIDTGIESTHQDLQNQIWSNTGEIASNSTDDDSNGYVDDTWGWDFFNSDNDPTDDHNHGTHCAGTVAAEGNNSIGVVGVAFQAKLMALKGLDASGTGDSTALVNCMNYAVNNGADVMSNSWGGQGYSTTYATTVTNAVANGVVPVFAMANDNQNGTMHAPANCPHSIGVAASTQTDGRASFSNYGINVDVTAPGVAIRSTVTGNTYADMQGTSMATPHVAGAMAVLISDLNARSVTASVEQMRTMLRNRADDQEATGWDRREGHGRLNLNAMMGVNPALYCEAVILLPDPLNPVTANSITITGYAAGPRFQDYTLEYAPGIPYDSASWTTLTTSSTSVSNGTLHTWDISSLPDGRYTIRLTVRNDQNTAFTERIDFVRDTFSDDAYTSAVEVLGNPLTFHAWADRNHTDRNDDWFKMECVGGVDYEFRTTHLSGKTDTVLDLYQSDGTTLITTNDDYPNPGDKESRITWTCSSSGTYYLRMYGWANGGSPTDPGSCRIHFIGLFKDGQESDNTSATAKPITAGGYASHHSIVPAGDVDWMSVVLVAGRTYTFETSKADPTGSMALDLYSTDGSTLLQTGTAGSDNRVRVSSWTCPSAGTYFLRASAAAGATGHYQARVYEKQDILYAENFQVVGADLWTPTLGTWAVAAGAYEQTDRAKSPHYSSAGFPGWDHVVLDGRMSIRNPANGQPTGNTGLMLRYLDDDNYVVARIHDAGRAEILQWENGTGVFLAQINKTFTVGTLYPVRVTFEGDKITFDIDGTVLQGATLPRFAAGKIGLRSYGTESVFDDLKLWRPGLGTLVDLVLNAPALADGMVGASYPAQNLTASGGTTPYVFASIGGTLPPGLSVAADGSITGTPTTAGAYVFNISVTDAAGRIRTGTASITVETAPASITVPANSSTGNYTVSWSAVAGASSYDLEEDTNPAFPSPTTVYSGAATSFNVTGNATGTYYYRVRATNAGGTSGWTVGGNPCVVLLPPPAPASITVPPGSITGNYTVSWAASATATSYTLEEDTNPGFTSPTVVYSGPATSFNVVANPNGTYYYRVLATNASGNSGWTVGANPCVVSPIPLPPATITVPAASATGNYTVSWAASAGATSYTLEEDTNAAFPAPVVAYTGAATSFNVVGKPPGTYYYRVLASNLSGSSGWRTGANPCVVAPIPAPPASVTVPLNSITGNFTVSWAASAWATSYTLEEDTNAAFPAPVMAYTGAAVTFNVTGKTNGTYYYRVLASNLSGNSGWTAGANGCTVLLPPLAPA